MTIDEIIAKLEEQRMAQVEIMRKLTEKVATENRTELSEEEQRQYNEAKAEEEVLRTRKADFQAEKKRQDDAAAASAAAEGAPDVRVLSEPRTYRRGARSSFFCDVFMATARGDVDAMTRLQKHSKEQHEELEARRKAYERHEQEIREHQFDFVRSGKLERDEMRRMSLELERRDLSRVDGAGGEFVPPLWLVDEFVALARAGRVTADLFNGRPLPPGTDSINIPRVTGGAATGVQTADNAAVTEVDPTTASVNVPVRTIAGQVDAAIQLLEQSPISFDEIIFADLIADYNGQVDAQVIAGTGLNGQLLGMLELTGVNTVTYTDLSPTVPELYPKIADAVARAAAGRKLPPTAIVMNPRRWFWIAAALDAQNRPLVAINAPVVLPSVAQATDLLAEGPVGFLLGLPVYIDANVPINRGAGTNEDAIVVSRFLDHWLWESFLRTRVLPEVGSGTLTVRMQVYNYVAGTAGRYPAATSEIEGSGLATPTF